MKIFLLFVIFAFCGADQDFTNANRWFSTSVYKKISKNTDGNFLVSPLSAQTILALTQAGSRGSTAEEIRTALNFTNDAAKIEKTFKSLGASLTGKYTLRTANKIYVKENFSIKPEFKRVATEIYHADCETVDFTKKKKAAQVMNTWVENQTGNKIHNLIDSSNLNNKTRVVLINALYFQANWSRPFPVAYTKKIDFHFSKTEASKVDMMLLHEKNFNYYESTTLNAKFLELPFKGGEASMVIVLPNEIDGLQLLETQIRKVLKPHKFTSNSFNVALPRFKVETSVDFKQVLKKMGVSKAFDKDFADLSGIAGEKGDLVVDKVAQKTFIDVSEEGVEAAAATYVLIAIPMSAPAEPPRSFKVDRPFIFYIKIKDLIVFVGRVTDPRG